MAEASATSMTAGENPAASLQSGGVTITEAAPKQGTPEHAAWVAKQTGNPAAESKSAMPEGGVEKFFNKETGAYDWSNHVKELNYRLEQGRTAAKGRTAEQIAAEAASATAAAAAEAAKTPKQKAAEAGAKEAAKAAGLNWDDLESRVNSTGKLEDSDYAAFENAGIPKRFVDNYMQALTIARAAVVNEVLAYTGGKATAAENEAELNGLIQWAAVNLPAEEKKSFNSVLASDQWRVAIDGMKAKRSAANGGNEPHLMHGSAAQGDAGVGFKSPTEMSNAINARDEKGRKKYEVDPEYRKSVRARIAASDFNPSRM